MKKNRTIFIFSLFLFIWTGFNFNMPVFGEQNAEQAVLRELAPPPENSLDISVDEAIQNSTQEVVTPHVEDIREMTPNANKEIKNEVLKDTNNNLKNTAVKFLYAIIGVLISSIAIFLILLLINKMEFLKDNPITPFKQKNDDTKEEINSPGGENEALKIFFEKTK